MITKKVPIASLFYAYWMILMLGVGNVKEVDAKVCPFTCIDGFDYMTCPSTGDQKLGAPCNCCLAPSAGCILHSADGNIIRTC
ncbi:unnamed protein product [Amaranthus hypochondriacus]